MLNKCQILWLVLIAFVSAVLVYFVFFNAAAPAPPAPDLSIFENQKLKLEQEKQVYKAEIKNLKIQQTVYVKNIDSLLNLSQQKEVVYIHEQNEIDIISSSDLVNEFRELFAELKIN